MHRRRAGACPDQIENFRRRFICAPAAWIVTEARTWPTPAMHVTFRAPDRGRPRDEVLARSCRRQTRPALTIRACHRLAPPPRSLARLSEVGVVCVRQNRTHGRSHVNDGPLAGWIELEETLGGLGKLEADTGLARFPCTFAVRHVWRRLDFRHGHTRRGRRRAYSLLSGARVRSPRCMPHRPTSVTRRQAP